jgi:hypothetical protein
MADNQSLQAKPARTAAEQMPTFVSIAEETDIIQ